MSRVLLLQIDGKLPNLALMRIAAHHRDCGDEVILRRVDHVSRVAPRFGDAFDKVYASAIFSKSEPIVREVTRQWPGAIIGGTGVDEKIALQDFGVTTLKTDYSDYPGVDYSMGFVFRGCRLNCTFCCVPGKEGKTRPEQSVAEIWRGSPYPKHLMLLDNDFGGHPTWRARAREIIDGKFRVSFFQGINARLLSEELAEALAAMDLRDGDFRERRFYTAWDNRRDERTLFRGLEWLAKAGIKPDSIMVYILCGYCHLHSQAASRCPAGCPAADHHEDRDYRRRRLREFGARPYPMPYERTPELVGFQRWCVRRDDLTMSWREFMGANYRPERVTRNPLPLLEEIA